MSEKEIEVFETTAGQVTEVLERLGVPKERSETAGATLEAFEADWRASAGWSSAAWKSSPRRAVT